MARLHHSSTHLLSILLLAGLCQAHAAQTITDDLTLAPTSAPTDRHITLTLDGWSTATPAEPHGLTLTYIDEAISVGIFRLHRPVGSFQWQLSNSPGAAASDRLAMVLGNDQSLNIYAPQQTSPTLVLDPNSSQLVFRFSDGGGDPAVLQYEDGWLLLNGYGLATMDWTQNAFLAKQPSNFASFGSTASNQAYALGVGLIAGSPGQIALGKYNVADGSMPTTQPLVPISASAPPLLTIGMGTSAADRSNAVVVRGDGVVQMSRTLMVGRSFNVDADSAVVVGQGLTMHGGNSLMVGLNSYMQSLGSLSVGQWHVFHQGADNYGWDGLLSGQGNDYAGEGGISVGYWYNEGWGCASFGIRCAVSGQGTFASGASTARGYYCSAMGPGNIARAYGQAVVGRFNVAQGDSAASSASPEVVDDLFVVGNGTAESARSNALVVKSNGDVNVSGVLRVPPAGDLGMGDFTTGTQP